MLEGGEKAACMEENRENKETRAQEYTQMYMNINSMLLFAGVNTGMYSTVFALFLILIK